MYNVDTRRPSNINDVILLLLSMIFVADILTNVATTSVLVVTLVLLVCLILLNLQSIPGGHVLLILLNILCCACTLIRHKGTGVVLIFLTLLVACICFNSISFHKKARRWVYFICFASLLLMVATGSYSYQYKWLVFFDKHGNFINNNTLGIFAVGFSFCLLMWNDLREGQIWKKRIVFVSVVIGFLFVYLTKCRSAILAFLVYFGLHLLIKMKISNKLFRRITILVLVLSLLYPVFYVATSHMWPNLTIFNKSLFSGREVIWAEVFKQIKNNPIFGSGTAFAIGDFESVHNMLLGIWKNVGLIPLISIMAVFAMRDRVSISRKQQIMLLSILIIAFFESFMMDIKFLLVFAFLMTGTNENNTIKEK